MIKPLKIIGIYTLYVMIASYAGKKKKKSLAYFEFSNALDLGLFNLFFSLVGRLSNGEVCCCCIVVHLAKKKCQHRNNRID